MEQGDAAAQQQAGAMGREGLCHGLSGLTLVKTAFSPHVSCCFFLPKHNAAFASCAGAEADSQHPGGGLLAAATALHCSSSELSAPCSGSQPHCGAAAAELGPLGPKSTSCIPSLLHCPALRPGLSGGRRHFGVLAHGERRWVGEALPQSLPLGSTEPGVLRCAPSRRQGTDGGDGCARLGLRDGAAGRWRGASLLPHPSSPRAGQRGHARSQPGAMRGGSQLGGAALGSPLFPPDHATVKFLSS